MRYRPPLLNEAGQPVSVKYALHIYGAVKRGPDGKMQVFDNLERMAETAAMLADPWLPKAVTDEPSVHWKGSDGEVGFSIGTGPKGLPTETIREFNEIRNAFQAQNKARLTARTSKPGM